MTDDAPTTVTLRKQLILKTSELRPDLIKFYDQIRTDARARERFLSDPAKYLQESSFAHPTSELNISGANRLLFSLLSNREFLSWAEQYSRDIARSARHALDRLPLEQIYLDVANAIATYCDKALVVSIFGDYEAIAQALTGRSKGPVITPAWVYVFVHIAVVVLPIAVLLVQPPDADLFKRDDLAQLLDGLTHSLMAEADNLRSSNRLDDASRPINEAEFPTEGSV